MLPDSHWFEMGEPATPAEAAALRQVREILPDDGITTAWANLTFIDHNGRTAEVDVLLLTKRGFFVVELKGWHGTIRGSSQWWTVTGRTTRQMENPLLLTDRKAKRLSTLLKDYAPNDKARASLPFVGALVVLHGGGSRVELADARARTGILTLDGYDVRSPKSQRVGTFKSFVSNAPNDSRDFIDHHRATLVRAACERADFKPTPKQRSVGHFVVADAEPIAEGPTWQDYHGGASLAEITVPVIVLQRRGQEGIEGWTEAAPQAPAWWNDPVRPAADLVAAAPVEPRKRRQKKSTVHLSFDDGTEQGALFEVPAVPVADAEVASSPSTDGVDALLASAVYAEQRGRAGRRAVHDDVVAGVLRTLVEHGGRAHQDTLASAAGIPATALSSTLAAVRRVLNVEGYEALSVDADRVTVVLDRALLTDQFGVEV